MGAEKGPEKLSVPYGQKEQAVQKFKEAENEKAKAEGKEQVHANPKADFLNEQALDTETDKITTQIEAAGNALAPKYANKLTAKLKGVIDGEKTKLNSQLAKINKDSEGKLVSLAADSMTKLGAFNEIPDVKLIYELVAAKDAIAGISEMQITSYAKNSGYYKVINPKFETAVGAGKIQAVQKLLGVTADGKVGPETMKALSAMLGLGLKVEFGGKTILADGKTEVDADGNVVEPPKAEEPVPAEPGKPAEPAPAAPAEPQPTEPPKAGESAPTEPAAPTEPDAPGPEEPKETPEQISTAVFDQVQSYIAQLEGNKLYELCEFETVKNGNAIKITIGKNAGAHTVCEIKVDENGAIKFAGNNADIAREGIDAAVKGKIDAYVLDRNFFDENETGDGYLIKFAGEMQLKEYKIEARGQGVKLTHSANPKGNGVLEIIIHKDGGGLIGTATITKDGIKVAVDAESPFPMGVEGSNVVIKAAPVFDVNSENGAADKITVWRSEDGNGAKTEFSFAGREPQSGDYKKMHDATDKETYDLYKFQEGKWWLVATVHTPVMEDHVPVPAPAEPPEKSAPPVPDAPTQPAEEPKPAEPTQPVEPPKAEEPKPAEPTPEASDTAPEMQAVKARIGVLRGDLEAQKVEFTGEKLKAKVIDKLTTKDTPQAIKDALSTKINGSGFDTAMAAMVANLERDLSNADDAADPALAEQMLVDAEGALQGLNVDHYVESREVSVFVERLAGPIKAADELMAKIDTQVDEYDETTGNSVPKALVKSLGAKNALIAAMVNFITGDEAQFDLAFHEAAIIKAKEEDMNLTEDAAADLEKASRVEKWHEKSNKIDGAVLYSRKGSNYKAGDYKLVPDNMSGTGDRYGLWKYDDGAREEDGVVLRYEQPGWKFVAHCSKMVLDDKAAKNEQLEKTHEDVNGAVSSAYENLKKTSNVYGDFKVTNQGLDGGVDFTHEHPVEHASTAVCHFQVDEETGKIFYTPLKGKKQEISLAAIPAKMREAGDAHIRGLEYVKPPDSDTSPLYVKYKGVMQAYKFEFDDAKSGGAVRGIPKKVGDLVSVGYKYQKHLNDGTVRQVSLATFTINNNGTVTVKLNPTYKDKFEAKVENGKIVLKEKERKEKTEGCKADSDCPGDEICVDGRCVTVPSD
ncbi:hypothetical protein HY604_00180 [Candidatus Peregrinibacteria bacterium]|nr:hypothetical protein [Candidatus Peregrinibacteria bacterium]